MTSLVVGVILNGGAARRMGGPDKGSLRLGGRMLVERVVDRICMQVDTLILNVPSGVQGRVQGELNDGERIEALRLDHLSLPIVPDSCEGQLGPLAGILTGLEWARAKVPECEWVVSVPVDTPFLPLDLVDRLQEARRREQAEMALAASAGRRHPVIALWPVNSASALREALLKGGVRKMGEWVSRWRVAELVYEEVPVDPFFNINCAADLERAETLLAETI
ncbi:MAG: molybdenum cofactor guanylyltransferase [Proteobacteria bacterium]|nr:molybdenum cofactor guanylyltransferase [Pseudomonadota bacterium]